MADPQLRRAGQLILGSAIAAVLVWLLFRDTEWATVGEILRDVDLAWILAAQALLFSSHLLRVQRWTHIIRATRPISFRATFSAAQVGFLFNIVLPARLGEGVRTMLLARLAGFRVSTSAALVALDRLADSCGFLLVAAIALISFPGHRDVVLPAGVVGNAEPLTVSGALLEPLVVSASLILAIGLLLLAALYFQRSRAVGFLERRLTLLPDTAAVRILAARILAAARGFTDGMQVFSSTPGMISAALASLVAWLFAVASLGCILKAFGLDTSWYVPFAMQAMIALFSTAPVTPGLIGQFHLAVFACLMIAVPGVSSSEAKAVAIVVHFLAILPVVTLGLCGWLLGRSPPVADPEQPRSFDGVE